MSSSDKRYRSLLIGNVEKITAHFLKNLVGIDVINTSDANNFIWRVDGTIFNLRNSVLNLYMYKRSRCRQRDSLILYLLSEIHRLLLMNDTCTIREIYYKNPLKIRTQKIINAALIDICSMFHTIPWHFGIFSSGKGVVTGPLKMFITNGDVVDCSVNREIVLLPKTISAVDHMETTANLVLVVEKDTIFQKLITQMSVDGNILNMILITGKGFPDICTRVLVHRLSVECFLPIYILVDADPFGINIMQIYRTGSKTMAQFNEELVCPKMNWLGIHPSELDTVGIPTLPLTPVDYKKILDIHKCCNLTNAIKNELCVLQQMQRKSHIDILSSQFLLNDYVVNKIKRNLTL